MPTEPISEAEQARLIREHYPNHFDQPWFAYAPKPPQARSEIPRIRWT